MYVRGQAPLTRRFDELVSRFEEPKADARWHRPLFITTAVKTASGEVETSPTPCKELWEALTEGHVQAPKSVTQVV